MQNLRSCFDDDLHSMNAKDWSLILKSIGMIYHYEIKSQQNISTEQ